MTEQSSENTQSSSSGNVKHQVVNADSKTVHRKNISVYLRDVTVLLLVFVVFIKYMLWILGYFSLLYSTYRVLVYFWLFTGSMGKQYRCFKV